MKTTTRTIQPYINYGERLMESIFMQYEQWVDQVFTQTLGISTLNNLPLLKEGVRDEI